MTTSKQKLRGAKYGVWLISEDIPENFAMTLSICGSFTIDEFQQALDKVKRKYPSSATRVVKETDRTVYQVSDPDLKFPIRISERKHSKSWVDEVTTELTKPFDNYNEPSIRFIWVRGDEVSEIILICNHAFVDGFSVVYVVRDLLNYLGNSDFKVEPGTYSTAMTELIPDFPGKRSVIWRGRIKAALLRIFIALSSKKDNQWKEMVSAAKRPYYLLPWELTTEQTATLVEQSRANGATVHAALCTAFLRAFGEYYQNGWIRKIQSPIDLRKRLASPVNESFDLYIHLVEFVVNCAPERDFWEVAREIKQSFEHYSEDEFVFGSIMETIVLMDELFSVITPQIAAQSYTGVEYDLSISNLGRLDFPIHYGSLCLGAFYGPTIGTNPEEITLGVITIGGKMHFTMTFTDMKLTLVQAEEIKEIAMSHLADAAVW
jgi:NRPS condensation-like uncharacterized protein